MGMSASVLRNHALVARKTNVEYEGQQINQQRTTLSNQSANYYNDLLGMTVPVPPSVDNYTKVVYSFEDGALTNSLTALIAQANGKFTVSYLRTWTDDFSPVSASTSIITRNGSNDYSIGAAKLRELGAAISEYDFSYKYVDGGITTIVTKDPNDNQYYTTDENGNKTLFTISDPTKLSQNAYTGNDAYLKTLTTDEIGKLKEEEQYYKTLLEDKYGVDSNGWLVRYIEDSSTGKYTPYFYQASKVFNSDDGGSAIYSETGSSQNNIPCYTIGSANKTEEVKALKNCAIERDSTGRYINIAFPELDENGEAVVDGNGNIVYGTTYALTTNTITDQSAYDDAMNQYEYNKYEYDQAIEDINAKIGIVQVQDKNLELRLKQLDTEQDAISTEMDAVAKVIEKNIETSFKTFG